MKEGFHKGDRVVVTEDGLVGMPFRAGDTGTVLSDTLFDYLIPVRFDNKHPGRHSCGDMCEVEHGYFMYPHQLRFLEEVNEEPILWSDTDWDTVFGEMIL